MDMLCDVLVWFVFRFVTDEFEAALHRFFWHPILLALWWALVVHLQCGKLCFRHHADITRF